MYWHSDVVTISVNSEKTRLKQLMKIIFIIMNKSHETTIFHGRQKLTSVMKLRPEKSWQTSSLMLYTGMSP